MSSSVTAPAPKIDAELAKAARRIVAAAVQCDSDARTVLRVAMGERVRPGAARRITRALTQGE